MSDGEAVDSDRVNGAPSRGVRARFFNKGSVGRGLLMRVAAITVLVTALVSLVAVLSVQAVLQSDLDRELSATLMRQQRGDPGGAGPQGGLNLPGQRTGTIICLIRGNTVVAAILSETGVPTPIASQALDRIVAVSTASRPVTVDLGALGRYRMVAVERGSTSVVVGLSMGDIDRASRTLILAMFVVSVIGVLLGMIAVRGVMSQTLRPLKSLQVAAQRVSAMQLATGDVSVPVRIPTEAPNPGTEFRDVAEAFNYMLDNVGAALAYRQQSETKLRQFVADASHELRNPLAAIRGYAELGRRFEDGVPVELGRALSRIDSESKRMGALVEDLLLLARLDADAGIELVAIDASSLILDAVSDAMFAGPDHDWGVDLPAEPVMVMANQHRLHQVVVNVLSNARVHTPSGTSVTVGLRTDRDRAHITVEDNGPGMSAELQRRAFERFSRGDPSRVRSGESQSTGLGLAIVAALMSSQHGEAGIASEPGRTTVTLTLTLDR